MIVSDIIAYLPEAEPLIAEYGLHCFRCSAGAVETLEEGCRSHGWEDDTIDDLVADLNDVLRDRLPRPEELTVTSAAATALAAMLQRESKKGWGLAVIPDGHGGFCMELREKPEVTDRVFLADGSPDIRAFASALTLARIGGSAIDYRDERFKLDLPEDTISTCACSGKCACGKIDH